MAEEDWLFDSINLYRNLSMYDLQHCVTAMDFVGGGSMCLATQCRNKCQVIELVLPDKMLADEQSARLKKDKDFHMSAGGFCEDSVTQVKHILQSRVCALAEKGGKIGIWELGSDTSDLIIKTQFLPAVSHDPEDVLMAVTDTPDGKLLYGSRLNNLTMVDIKTGTKIMDTSATPTSDHVSAIYYHTPDTLLACSHNGQIHDLDLRCKEVKVTCNSCHGDTTKYWTMSKPNDKSNCVYKLSESGDIHSVDTRCLSKIRKQTTIEPLGRAKRKYLKVQQDPGGDKFSVSGFDGLVHIYTNSDFETCGNRLEPVFTHQGHMTCCDSHPDSLQVVEHMWHPWVENLIISTASDCSLHAWQYNT